MSRKSILMKVSHGTAQWIALKPRLPVRMFNLWKSINLDPWTSELVGKPRTIWADVPIALVMNAMVVRKPATTWWRGLVPPPGWGSNHLGVGKACGHAVPVGSAKAGRFSGQVHDGSSARRKTLSEGHESNEMS